MDSRAMPWANRRRKLVLTPDYDNHPITLPNRSKLSGFVECTHELHGLDDGIHLRRATDTSS